jgi:TetR/AcrR family transcriptional repressor of nem operon
MVELRVPTRSTAVHRERLLDAADRLMWLKGYEAVGVAELCEVAGAPRGSFYHWWPSKQALAVAMLEHRWQTLRTRLFEPVFGGDDDLGSQLDRYGDRLVSYLQRAHRDSGIVPGCPFGNFAAELAPRDAGVRAAVEDVFADMRSLFADAIRSGVVRGDVAADVDADDGADALCAHMEGLMILAKARNDPTVIARFARDARRLLGMTLTAVHPLSSGAPHAS